MTGDASAGHRPLAGRTALVTGASRGIGLETARRLAAAGARVALVARGVEALARAAEEIGTGAIPLPCDVSRPDAVEDAATATAEAFGGAPDVLVNNAGLFLLRPVAETDPLDFAHTLETNLVAPFLFTRAFLPAMRERGRGHVVTIGSIADRVTFPENGAYAASKYGMRALHQVMREELRGTGVRATLVSPGPVNTALWDPVNPDARPGFTPRAAMLSPAAVADAVLYAVCCDPAVNVDELRLTRA